VTAALGEKMSAVKLDQGGAVLGTAAREAGFRDFYAANFGDVAGYALALTSSRALAEEVAQEAMTAVYARWGGLREPRAYAFKVARNVAQDGWKSRNRELATWADLAAGSEPSALPDHTLWDAVRRLPPPLAEVVLLRYFADLRVEDVATALRRPPGTIKRRLFEARAMLATTLEDSR